jgi:hypothetical protein
VPIPLITAGVSAATQYLGNRKTAGEKGMEGVAAQQGLLAQKQGRLGDQIGVFAQGQHSMAQPALQKAMQYYTQLASGSRSGIQGALAPSIGALTETYRGAENGLMARSNPGASRDRQLGELARQKAGQLGLMPFQARESAIGNLAGMGQQLEGNAMRGFGMQGSQYNDQGRSFADQGGTYGNLQQIQRQRQQSWMDFGQNMAQVFLPKILGPKAGGSVLPSGRAGGGYRPHPPSIKDHSSNARRTSRIRSRGWIRPVRTAGA